MCVAQKVAAGVYNDFLGVTIPLPLNSQEITTWLFSEVQHDVFYKKVPTTSLFFQQFEAPSPGRSKEASVMHIQRIFSVLYVKFYLTKYCFSYLL